ncbi:MAG: hypothetical protein A3H32_04195 [Betaproteobacteria bacterium RIFCSPLOWO2_02_FULL_63_19]|nr:MAG: hypothetical protein A3H32_04195 [Betaproteobacteria bacterium RIFCSPLOWO2_02_FULL_63_19]
MRGCSAKTGCSTILKDEVRLLTFRAPGAGIREHPNAYLAFGLAMTWAAGMGRYWDSPAAALWQHLGLGSLGYVFVLAAIIWLVVTPLGPRNWSYRNVLLFVSLTSPPALLYAIPVEAFFAYGLAHAINAAFLAVVAAWRVPLLAVFLNRAAGLKGYTIAVAASLPLVLIVNGLAVLGVEHAVYANMVGDHDPNGPGKDGAEAGRGRLPGDRRLRPVPLRESTRARGHREKLGVSGLQPRRYGKGTRNRSGVSRDRRA